MSSPKESSEFTTRLVYTEAPGFWDKARGGLGTVVTAIANLTREALLYEGKAATVYSTKPNLPNLPSIPDVSTYHGQSTPISQPNLTPLRPLPDYKSSRTGERALAQIGRSEPYLQRSKQWQTMQNQAIRTLNQMARAKGLPSYEQFHRENGVVDKFRPDQSDMGAKRFLAGETSPLTRRFLSEPNEPIQGAQQPVSDAQLLKARIQQSSEPHQDFPAKERPNTRQSSTDTPFLRKSGTTQVQRVVQQAFVNPRPGEPNILQQARQGRVAEHRRAQVELNLARMHAQGHMTPEQQANLEIGAKALFAANWLRHDAQDVGNGHITYRGITVERSLAPMLAYADAEQYWRQNTHLSPKQDWMDIIRHWFFEEGAQARIYDSSHPITQALMRDEGVQQARTKWVKVGKPNKRSFAYSFSVGEYIRELVTLDGTGSTLGSYSVTIERLPSKVLKFTVDNNTGWESGTRLPFAPHDTPSIEDLLSSKRQGNHYPSMETKMNVPFKYLPKSILSDKLRSDPGYGGNFRQQYIWYEKEP